MLLYRGFPCWAEATIEHIPTKKANHWVCEAPRFEIDFNDQASGTHIEQNNETYYVALHADYFDVFLQSEDDVLREENILLGCYLKYENDSMIVTIAEDHLFDGAYTELVFTPQ